MQVRKWLVGMTVGTMALSGLMAAGPLPAGAQDATAPAAQTEPHAASADEQAQGPAIVGAPLLQPTIDLKKAQEIALEGQTSAVVTSIELNGEDGVLTYSVELDNGQEVDVDATSGKVLKTEQGDQENGQDGENGEGEQGNGSEDNQENGSEQG